MTKTAFRKWIGLVAVAAALDTRVHADSTKRLRRDLVGGGAKAAEVQQVMVDADGNDPSYQLWADEETQSMEFVASLSFSTAATTLPEFPWHGLEDPISMSIPDVDLSVAAEVVQNNWDGFLADEATADLISKPTPEPSTRGTNGEELLLTSSPTQIGTNGEELLLTSSPTQIGASLSMSIPDVDLSVAAEVVQNNWDGFLADEATADLISKPTSEPSTRGTNGEELLLTSNPTQIGTNGEELLLTSSPTQIGASFNSPADTDSTESTKEQSALVQFEMQTMTRAMNDFEVFGIFQPTCIQFLTRELKYEEQIFGIDCKVTKQQLIGQISSSDRLLEEASSLVVDINVTGDATPDVQLKDMINGAFSEKSELFVNSLKVKGEKAEIDTFNELFSVTSVEQTNEKSAISSDNGTVEEGHHTGSLIVIITGVGLIVALIAGFAVSRSKTATARAVEERSLESAGPPHDILASPKKEAGAFNFDLGFLNTLCQEPEQTSYLPNSLTSGQVIPKVRREVVAPRGKLGIITEDSELGVIIHSVKDESPLEGLLFPGDLIEALDNMDISHLSSSNLTKLMVSKCNYERKITVLSERLHTNYSD